jgi:uncharacterized protein (DUF58 family)
MPNRRVDGGELMGTGRTLRLTPSGAAFVAAAVVIGLLGVIFTYVALLVVALSMLVGVMAGVVSTRSVPPLDIDRIVEPSVVQRGQHANGLVSVRNTSRSATPACTAREPISTAQRHVAAAMSSDDDAIEVPIPGLRRGQMIALPYELPTHRRGAVRIGPLMVDRRDPFGLVLATRVAGSSVEVLVEPRVHSIDPRPAGRRRHLDGPTSDTAPRGTLTFHSLREYTPGDDIRHVHWRSTAKTGTMMVREQVDTSLPSTVIVLDTRHHRYRGDDFEEAVDVAASMVAASDRHGFPTRLITTDGDNTTVRSGERAQALRALLSVVEATESGSMRDAAAMVLAARERDAIVVISGAVDADDLTSVSTMTRRFDQPALVTIRPSDADSALRWSDGPHFDGATALAALAAWGRTGSR